MTESPVGTILLTKDDRLLLDGYQADAVIAVRVNYDARPLPAEVVNTAEGRIKPPGAADWFAPVTANSPPLRIDGITVDWNLTKSLYSPSIEPTVDTNVTYRIQLCPGSTSGNAGLSNIVITDTLPAGAQFIYASNGGAESSGVVTWTVAGPVNPPSCVTRYVTVRFNTAAPYNFSVGDSVTNSVSATADYTPSDGGVCAPNCYDSGTIDLDHNLIDICEIPTYSKGDAGDPVGITGTARFLLTLHTNGTNYPANAVTLIDNLPAELKVTGVTSGTWASQYVRATVQYATNYAPNTPNWTDFPGQPVEHDDDALYDSGLPDNITRIRWVFEYDSDPDDLDGDGDLEPLPGLPYDWSFSTRPEIRVTPRDTATTASDGTSMPAAVVDNVYTNCLQVSRVDSSGTPVTGACSNESMTVRGDYVSLRTTKAETPGGSYDPLYDALIDTFTADSSILPNDTLQYVLTVEVTERSSLDLIDPTIQDTIPVGLVFVREGTAQLDGVDIPSTFTKINSANPDPNDGATLKWSFPGLTVPHDDLGSHYLTVSFFARVPPGTPPNVYTNSLYVATDSLGVMCEIPGTLQTDDQDIDGDGNATEPACKNTDDYRVERSAALRGEKWIRSIDLENSQVVRFDTFMPDAACPVGGTIGLEASTNPFTRYPCIAQAYPEGALSSADDHVPPPSKTTLDDFEYNLRIFNEGNVPMLEYVLYDILPYYGDTGSGGVLSNSPRLSQFRPVLRGPVEFISGPGGLSASDFTIEYNNSTNPCRPEVFDKDPVAYPVTPMNCSDSWTTTGWDTARSYRIRLTGTGASIQAAVSPGQELRFGVPMYIPKDAPPTGFDQNDAQSKEIAWNSFAHVGSYDKDPDAPVVIQDLLASEPRKVGITIPEVMSIGNRVWRDSDNSGTINPPDDANPGIGNVTVNLYAGVDADGDGIPDDLTVLATTTTDSEGFYLFSNLSAGNYIVGISASNFGSGQPLYTLRSSTGTPAAATYITPADANPDQADHGRDPATIGDAVYSPLITLSAGNEQTSESDLSNNDRDGPFGTRRGLNGERDYNSDLTVDFGFFGGTDVPFSIGNHLWYDDGTGGGVLNDGLRQAGELPVVGARVELYRDGNLDGNIQSTELIRFDVTDADGFYLFDNLDPGNYYVYVAPGNFTDLFDPDGDGALYTPAPGVLRGWYSSQVTALVESSADSDDNGIDVDYPETNGVLSSVVLLERGVNEPTGETHLSNDASTTAGFNPTAGDGAGHIGRFGETDENSNVTVDFGFIPPMSLGNRVWFDNGSTAGGVVLSQYNNGVMDGSEAGVSGVTLQLYKGGTLLRTTTTDAQGYYLFDRLQPGDNYTVRIPASAFTTGPLTGYISSYDKAAPSDDATDVNDNGIDAAAPGTNGVSSQVVVMAYGSEPQSPVHETDLSADTARYGVGNVGLFGQTDTNSNLTLDFGFVRPPRSIGNRLWFDVDNDRVIDASELPVPNAIVRLYRDSNNNGVPDDVNGDTLLDFNDALFFDTTDANGYYLFDNLPPGRYLVGVDYVNFQSGNVLDEHTSSTGTTTNNDNRDNGIDRVLPGDGTASPYGILSGNINMTGTSPTGESSLSGDTTDAGFGVNPTAWDGPNSRGRYGEVDNNSNLRIDFGFFKPMSIGNRVFRDEGGTTGTLNNGIMDGDELPFANVRLELYRDNNNNGVLNIGAGDTLVNFDVTDAGGYYLFDRLVPGNYFVYIPASNFTGAGTLRGWYTSTPTGTENAGVAGNPYTPSTDRDDNGVNNIHPEVNGIASGLLTLAWDSEPAAETELSGSTANPGAPTNDDFNPTSWDGPGSRGRWNESDDNSNLTVDFGFIPPLSLGNRVWIDDGSAATGLVLSQFNDDLMNGSELGRGGVVLSLYFDANNDGDYEDTVDGVSEAAAYRTTTTDAGGYYLFDGLPQGSFYVRVNASNFAASGALEGYHSSSGVFDNETDDLNDNGQDSASYLADGIRSMDFILGYGSEPVAENVSTDTTTYGPNGWGRYGESDASSNLTLDFGFMVPRSLGNRVWLDDGGATGTASNGIMDGDEAGIDGVTVSLYADNNGDGVPDGVALLTDTTSDGGYYLFSNFPPGQYLVGVDSGNFAAVLQGLASSADAAGHPVDADADLYDHGIDGTAPAASTYGILSPTIDLRNPSSEPTGETDLSGRAGDGPASRGTHGEADNESDLTVDFGFFYPFSLGNRVFRDDGGLTGTGTRDNGIMDGDETPIANVRVELYRDTDGTAGLQVSTDSLLRFDITDANGYYLFDGLTPGEYYVHIPASNFNATGALYGHKNSSPTGTETIFVTGNDLVHTPSTDSDDNGVNDANPTANGISGGPIVLSRDAEPAGEALSGDVITTAGNNPTAGDGPNSRGRYGESDNNSNLTVDFGFVPVFALGNRVWFDTDNSSTINGSEVGIDGVTVRLFSSDGVTEIPVGADGILGTGDDSAGGMLTYSGGYYLFNNLSAGDYIVVIPASNFSGVLAGYWSSATVRASTGALTETTAALANSDIDSDDNGTLQTSGPLNGAVTSSVVTLGAAITSEPAGESDLGPSGQGQPDTQANMTVDFGFYTVQLGDLVWNDTDNSGAVNGAESGIPNVDVELWSSDGTSPLALLATDTTDGSGLYSFTGLPAGDYILRIPSTQFEGANALRNFRSSTGGGTEPAQDADVVLVDSDDNGEETGGILGLGGYVETKVVTLTPAAEASANNANGLTLENRVDFGFFGGPQADLAITKDDGVTFYLQEGALTYTVIVTNNGPADVIGLTVNDARPAQITTWEWTCASSSPNSDPATYGCTPDVANPAMFTDTLDLPYRASVTYTVVAQVDSAATGAIDNTATVTAPAGYTEIPTTPDNNIATDTDQLASLSIAKDNGLNVVAPASTFTYNIVLTNTGAVALTDISVEDTLPTDVTFQSASPAPAAFPVPGTPGGTLVWDGISLAAGANTSFDVTVRVNDTATGASITNTVTATDENTSATAMDDDTDTLAVTNDKVITNTNINGDIDPQVLIGEVITYQISLTLPPGTLVNLKALDELESGLAFEECLGVSVSDPGTVSTTLAGGFPDACPAAAGDPDVTDTGHKVLFNFGDVTNSSATDQTLTVLYLVDVLDVAANVNGVNDLNNKVTWTWDGGALEASAPPLEILEPDMSILKTASPDVALLGSTINFKIDIEHTDISTVDAYDVVVTDQLPSGLQYVGNVTITGLAYDRFNYDTATSTITFEWDVFPLLATSSITFEATFVGPPPVVNEASVAWTSIPLDPGVQSSYNPYSTERFYDPLDPAGVNDYGVTSSATINIPKLPKTGFAPGRVTPLPAQPRDMEYLQLDALTLEIPRLGVKLPIVGIPTSARGWDLTWLSNQAGWLEGTAYPTLAGNTGLTAHAYLADGTPGPFSNLGSLYWGDKVYIHANGNKYMYEVREVRLLWPENVSVLRHEEFDWITLITCREYNEKLKDYTYRVVVRAVLLKVELE